MGLLVWLPLNGNLNNNGLSSGTAVITSSGATINNNGKIGKTYLFDANDDYISIDSDKLRNCFKGGANPFTIAMWIYNTKTTGARGIPFGDYSLSGTIGFNLELNSSGGSYNDDIRFYWNGSPDYRATNTNIAPNTWVHLAIVYDGEKVDFYRNGILVNTRTGTLADRNKTAGVFYLGRDGRTGGTAFGGYLNDFRVYDTALSKKQVREIAKGLVCHYKLDAPKGNPNLLVNSYTPTAWTYEGCARVNDSNPHVIGFTPSANYNRIYLGVSNVWNSGQTYTYSFDAKASVDGVGLDASRSIANFGPVHYLTTEWKHYSGQINSTETATGGTLSLRGITGGATYYVKNIKLENGTKETIWIPNVADSLYTLLGYANQICTDVSGNGYNLIQDGAVTFNTDTIRYSGSSLFDGDTSCFTIPYNTMCPSNIFTVNIWFKKDSVGTKGYETLFGGPAGFEMDTRSGTSSTLSLYMASTRGGSMGALTMGEWNMVTMVRDGTNEYYYINGGLSKTIEAKSMPTGTYYIGAWKTATQQNYYGLMSDFRIYATPLSADDILTLYKDCGIIDKKKGVYAYEFKEE